MYYNISDTYFYLIALIIITLFSSLFGERGKLFAFYSNIVIVFIVLAYAFMIEEVRLSTYIYLDKIKLRYVFLFSLICLSTVIINGKETLTNVGNSIINNIILISSVSILGATDWITFLISISLPVTLTSMLFMVNNRDKYISYRVSALNIFMLTMLYFVLGFHHIFTSDPANGLAIFLGFALLFLVTSFFVGLYPFSAKIVNITNSEHNSYYTSNMIFIWGLIGFSLITNLLKFIEEVNPVQKEYLILFNVLIMGAMVIPSLIALFKKELKEVLSYVFMSHSAYIMLVINLSNNQRTNSLLLLYFVFHGIIFASILMILNSIKCAKKNIIYADEARGYIFKNIFLGTVLLVMLLSIMGVPFTAGAFGKFTLFVELLKMKHFALVTVSMVSMILGAVAIFKTFFPMFIETNEKQDFETEIHWKYYYILMAFTLFVFLGGVIPKGISFLME